MIACRSSSDARDGSSVAEPRAAARTSSGVTRPPLPLGRRSRSRTPISFASLRVAGAANGLACPAPPPNSAAPGNSSEICPTALAGGRLDLCASPTFDSTEGSSTRMTCPTLATAPTSKQSASTRASHGAPIVTVALSVITSTIGASSAIESPHRTNHSTISPSVTPSPMSGSLKSRRVMTSTSRSSAARARRDAQAADTHARASRETACRSQ